ncbi:g11575 [Coccomyxa elongata]
MDPPQPSKKSKWQYLRCTPRSTLFELNNESQRSHVLLHAVSKWAKGEAAPTNLAKGRGINVNSHFDSGNIEVVDISQAQARGVSHELNLRIHADPYCESDDVSHFMWFYFRVTGAKGEELHINITNAGEGSFPVAWPGYQTCATYDRKFWFRVPTTYDKDTGVLSWKHTPAHDAVRYAYFAPYPYEQHQTLIADCQSKPGVTLEMLGQTLDGHDLDLLRIGDADDKDKKKIWVIARQHPGESMAEWFMDGMLKRLLDHHDPVSRKLLQQAVFYVVPNMNPDGTWRGHLRTNAAGANLNREWDTPTLEHSPEVYYVRNHMDLVGCDFLADIHGDEEIEYNFLAGNEGIPAWDDRLKGLQDEFCQAFLHTSPDFQMGNGYGVDPPGQANLAICSSAVGQRYNCLAFTLEMPFKDVHYAREPVQGWSPERSVRFGAAILNAILAVVPDLR